jgi:glycerol kinase
MIVGLARGVNRLRIVRAALEAIANRRRDVLVNGWVSAATANS